jgi:hypothetical protein
MDSPNEAWDTATRTLHLIPEAVNPQPKVQAADGPIEAKCLKRLAIAVGFIFLLNRNTHDHLPPQTCHDTASPIPDRTTGSAAGVAHFEKQVMGLDEMVAFYVPC